MILFRKILFYIFLAVYLVFCPMIILYGLGYSIRPQAKERLVKTGLIYLSSAPPGASVYIGKSRYAQKTPAVLRDLVPGEYPIRLELKGYSPWSQTLSVEAEKASVLENILMLPEKFSVETIQPERCQTLVSIPDTDHVLFPEGTKAADLLVYHARDKKISPLFPRQIPWVDAERIHIYTVRESTAIVLHLRRLEKDFFYWMDLTEPKKPPKDLSGFMTTLPRWISWNPQNKRLLFVLEQDTVNRIDVESGDFSPGILKNVRGVGISRGLFRNDLYAITSDDRMARYNFQGKLEEWILKDASLVRSIFGHEEFFEIFSYPENLFTFLGDKGKLITNKLPYRFIDKGVLGLEFDPKFKRLLVWQKNRLGFLNYFKEDFTNDVFEKAPELEWRYSQGRNIAQAFRVFNGSHILFRDGSGVFLLECESYGESRLEKILEVLPGSEIYYSEESGKVYYLDRETGYPSAMELVPKKLILPFPFPEFLEPAKRKEQTKK